MHRHYSRPSIAKVLHNCGTSDLAVLREVGVQWLVCGAAVETTNEQLPQHLLFLFTTATSRQHPLLSQFCMYGILTDYKNTTATP